MRRPASLLVLLASLLVAACSSASPASSSAAAVPPTTHQAGSDPTPHPRQTQTRQSHHQARRATPFTPWYTYHRTATRTGHASHAVGSPLHHAWTRALGQVYGEPLVVGGTLIVATEGNRVFGLNARTGRARWSKGLGRPQPLSGLPDRKSVV